MFNHLIGKSKPGGRDCTAKFNYKLLSSVGTVVYL